MEVIDVIKGGLKSFETLLDFIKKPINFDEAEPHKFKSIVEGRKTAFEVANSQLTKIKQLEDSAGILDEDKYRNRLKMLADSTDSILIQIKKVLEADINVADSEDDKVKNIVQSKSLSFDLMQNIINVRDSIKLRLDSKQSLIRNESRNFASEQVKNK